METLKIYLTVFFLRFRYGVINLRYRPLLNLCFIPISIGIAVLCLNYQKAIALFPSKFPWLITALGYSATVLVIFLSVMIPVCFVVKVATSFHAKSDKGKIQRGFLKADKSLDTNLLFVLWRQREKGSPVVMREIYSHDISGGTWGKHQADMLWALDSKLTDDIEAIGNKRIRFRTIPNRAPKARPVPQDPLFKKDGSQ